MVPSVDPWTQITIDSDTLVARLRGSDDQEAWRLVDARYGPVLLAFAGSLGLDLALAEDARQDAMMVFAHAIRDGKLDRSRGRLRDFLFGIARNKIIDLLKSRQRSPIQVVDDTDQTGFFERLPDPNAWEERWKEEWETAISRQCLLEAQQRFTSDTYRAFYLKAIEGQPSAAVAPLLGKTVAAVDTATSRIRSFLRKLRPEIEEMF